MAGDIQHSALPDSLLHEPKGASTALEGTVYIANGEGSGSFDFLPMSDVAYTRTEVASLTPATITGTVSLDGSTLSQTPDGVLLDVPAQVDIPVAVTNKINENAAELLRLYNNQATINTETASAISALENKLNDLITALNTAGVIEQ